MGSTPPTEVLVMDGEQGYDSDDDDAAALLEESDFDSPIPSPYESDEEVKTMVKQWETLKIRIEEAQEQKLAKESELKQELEKCQEEVRVLKDEIQVWKMSSGPAGSSSKVLELEKNNELLKAEMEGLKEQVERAKEETRMAALDLIKSSDKLEESFNISTAEHREEMATLQKKFEAAQEQLSDQRQEILALQDKRESALDQLAEQRRESLTLRNKHESAQASLAEHRREMAALQNKLESAQEHLAEFRLQKQIAGLNQIVSGGVVEQKERELAESKKLLDIAQKQNRSGMWKLGEMKREMNTMKEKLENTEKELAKAIDKNEKFKVVRGPMMQGLAQKLMKANEALSAKDKEMDDLRTRIRVLAALAGLEDDDGQQAQMTTEATVDGTSSSQPPNTTWVLK